MLQRKKAYSTLTHDLNGSRRQAACVPREGLRAETTGDLAPLPALQVRSSHVGGVGTS